MEGNRKKYVKKEQTRTNTPLFGGGFVQTVHGHMIFRKFLPELEVE